MPVLRGTRVHGVDDIQRLMVADLIGADVDVEVLRGGEPLHMRLVPRELLHRAQPELVRTVGKAACQQHRDGGDVGFADLAAADSRHGSVHSR